MKTIFCFVMLSFGFALTFDLSGTLKSEYSLVLMGDMEKTTITHLYTFSVINEERITFMSF